MAETGLSQKGNRVNFDQLREHRQLLQDVEVLKQQIAELKQRIEKLEQKRGPGRPRKVSGA